MADDFRFMTTKHLFSAVLCLAFSVGLTSRARAAERGPIPLPGPQLERGQPLMQVLKARQSVREFTTEPLSQQTLANLLWAAFGMNRPEITHRTAPSAQNGQEIDLYVATTEAVYLYEATNHTLVPVLDKDIRAFTGSQAFVKQAPVSLIFVADHAKMKARAPERDFYAAIDTGFISQNVYLFCASEGLGTVIHDLDRAKLAAELPLRAAQKIVIAQAVGHPKK